MSEIKGTVIVTGGNGQLARAIQYLLSLRDLMWDYNYVFPTHKELDITSKGSINNYISQFDNVKYIVNCASYTNVDKAEDDFELCRKVNVDGVANLAEICKENNNFLITFGSDYMYDGINSPIKTWDSFKPLSEYGKSKCLGYKKILEIFNYDIDDDIPRYLFINTSWLYSEFGNNFVKTIYSALKRREERKVVIDQIGSPTYAPNLAAFILNYVENTSEYKPYNEIINFSDYGIASWFDIAKEIEYHLDLSIKDLVKPCTTYELKQKALRPKYSVLSHEKFEDDFGYEFEEYWRNSLRKCLKQLDKLSNMN